jgi:hypothetical protein
VNVINLDNKGETTFRRSKERKSTKNHERTAEEYRKIKRQPNEFKRFSASAQLPCRERKLKFPILG